MRTLIIQLNNWITRLRRVRVAGRNLLLLAPHCLQNSRCPQSVIGDMDQCRRCGQCEVAGLLNIRDRYGLSCKLAGGGQQAVDYVKQRDVRAVVAVACERELTAGILASFPLPVLALPNKRPRGACKDTAVDLDEVERAVRSLLLPSCLPPEEPAVHATQDAEGD